MSLLSINVIAPAKYADFDTAVKHHIENSLRSALYVPFCFTVSYSADFADPVCQLHGRTKRIGPVTEGKIRCAVRQGLAITRNSCSVAK